MVFSLAYHFLRNRAAAEDLAQDVFLYLYHKLPELQSAAHVRFWLRRVTSHRCIDYSRRHSKDIAVEPSVYEEWTSPDTSTDILLSESLRKLVASLPEHARIVVILRYQEDLEPMEIAEILEIPVGTVKSQLHRALALLRGKLEKVSL